jgi:hypothetical protein
VDEVVVLDVAASVSSAVSSDEHPASPISDVAAKRSERSSFVRHTGESFLQVSRR